MRATPPPFKAAAQDDTVWHAKAAERYPAATLNLEHYGSWQAGAPGVQPTRAAAGAAGTASSLANLLLILCSFNARPPQALLRDDNAEHASLVLDLPGRSCR